MKKTIAMVLLLMLCLTVFAGCSNEPHGAPALQDPVSDTPTETPDTAEPTDEPRGNPAEPNTDEPADEAVSTGATLPIAEGESFSLFYSFFLDPTAGINSYSESDVFRELEQRTGVTVEIDVVPFFSEQFALMFASGDLYDVIYSIDQWDPLGGFDKLIEDELLMDIADVAEKHAPDYMALINSNEALTKTAYTDQKRMPGFVQIQHQSIPGPTGGLVVRGDWLNDLGISVESLETYDGLHDAIVQMKENYDATWLIDATASANTVYEGLLQGYNLSSGFMFAEDGKTVKYSQIDPQYRKYLTMLRDWYKEGLIHPDFVTGVEDGYITDQLSGGHANAVTAGAYYAIYGYTEDPDFTLLPITEPKETEDTVLHCGINDPYTTELGYRATFAVSTKAENAETIAKWFNYMYTDEGILLTNYGFEGDTFEYDANGMPQWTEKIYRNTEGINVGGAQQKYLWHFPPYSEFDKEVFTYDTQEQRDAPSIWMTDSLRDWTLPYGYKMTADEGAEYSAAFNDIRSYVCETALHFIMGSRDIDTEWDAFVEQVEAMGIDRCCELVQAAVERYYAR